MATPKTKTNSKEQPKKKTRSRINRKVEETLPEQAGPKYSLIDQIQKSPYFGKSPSEYDPRARSFINEHVETSSSNNINPGQLIMFNYFEPKTKEDLEYWDGMPCSIFFNTVQTTQGKRVLGFNIHYYPPKMRFQVMNTIFNIYKPIYSKNFKKGTAHSIEAFDYQYLIDSLEKAGLGFGVRMYIPELIDAVQKIPPQMWHIAVFTEGRFKKQTRAAILKHWKEWMIHHGQPVEKPAKKSNKYTNKK